MANNPVQRGITELDPMFNIPEGTDEFVYAEGTFGEDEDEGFEDYLDTPGVPDIYAVISQTLRTTPAGNQVVDLVLDVEDFPGMDKYDIRVTKI